MIVKGDRVRYLDKGLDTQYGVMEVWEIKRGYATCRFGDFHNFSVVTVKISDLKKT
ncbi:hypothetical protein D3C87_12570 [compost metagenome]